MSSSVFFPGEWLPNLRSKKTWKPYFEACQIPLSNPGSALVLQTKRFPLLWEDLDEPLAAWRELLPETRDPIHFGSKLNDEWVLKPALGRVGEGIGVPGITPADKFEELLKQACRENERWIAQRRFEILPVSTEEGAVYPCIGVFTVGGRAAGLYGRISMNPIIDCDAQDVAVLIRNDEARYQC